jgi:GTPase
MNDAGSDSRFGVVAVIGAPNAGKSTLVNHFVGTKVSIVTHKVQTTRFPVKGVAVRGDTQVLFIDTPGVFAPRRRLDRAMVSSAWAGARDADLIVHLVDAPAFSRTLIGEGENATPADVKSAEDVNRISEALARTQRKATLALNKVDAMARPRLFAVAEALHGRGVYTDVFMISAAKGSGTDALWDHLAAAAKPAPWMYPADQAADAPSQLVAAEVTREKLMLRLHDEVPYESTVETESWQERKDGSVRIEQTIYVARDSQKVIAIGEGGATLKAIGSAARRELETLFERRVHLFLHVKVREAWLDERQRFTELGLDFDV